MNTFQAYDDEIGIEAVDSQPATINYDPPTIEIGNERPDGHCHHRCELCSEEAIRERCPGFRLDWVCG
jgi:hypothetical protein